MSRKRAVKAAKNNSVFELSHALVNNSRAWEEGPKRKTWSQHDMVTLSPLTVAQEDMFHAYINNYNICGFGSAGTGKTFLALYLALTEVFNPKSTIDRIIIVKSTVPTREIGHLPGTVAEKLAPYERAYPSILYELIGKESTYEDMKTAGLIQFESTSFVRGMTWNNAMVIFEEFQNCTIHEFDSVITRLGSNSKIMILGDIFQNDLINSRKEVSGAVDVIRLLSMMNDEFAMVQFLPADIVRGKLVKSWIMARESLGV
jgi:phosphate starvation-inducible PhoH-like protein